MAQGGGGVGVMGCETCYYWNGKTMNHLNMKLAIGLQF